MIGAICGLGYDPETLRPLFVENDIEIKFDIVIDHNLLNKVNLNIVFNFRLDIYCFFLLLDKYY